MKEAILYWNTPCCARYAQTSMAQVAPRYDINDPAYVNVLESIESSRKDKDDSFPERFNQYLASSR